MSMQNGIWNNIPIATALQPATVDQSGEIKTGILVDSIPMQTNLVGVQTIPMQAGVKTVQGTMLSNAESSQVSLSLYL